MQDEICRYELWRLEVPTGREFGDCKCRFHTMDFLLLALKTHQGRVGWGFMQTMSRGVFTNSAPWVSPLPSLADLQVDFADQFWPRLQGKNPLVLKIQRPNLFSGYGGMKQAIRLALWDLAAQLAEMPLYQLLGGRPDRNRVRAYASGIDFPLSDEDAGKLFKGFAQRGFTAVKVKVGSPDPARDLRRLQVVRQAVGEQVEIAIDANEAWTLEEAIERIQFFESEGIRLAYVEDPLPRTEIDGFAQLRGSVEPDIVGHDYIVDDPVKVRQFMERNAFDRLRTSTDIDEAQAYAEIATEFGVPIIVGNTVFEIGVHAAVALPQTDRMEFSDVGWNVVPRSTVSIENGYAVAPSDIGHGLDPDPEQLKLYSRPEP
jgi:L-alanine-DL-glutamate epimerase-like enolase superfamily enzyme